MEYVITITESIIIALKIVLLTSLRRGEFYPIIILTGGSADEGGGGKSPHVYVDLARRGLRCGARILCVPAVRSAAYSSWAVLRRKPSTQLFAPLMKPYAATAEDPAAELGSA